MVAAASTTHPPPTRTAAHLIYGAVTPTTTPTPGLVEDTRIRQTVFSISKSVESLDIFTGRCVSMQCSAEEWHVSAGGGEAQCHHIGHRQSGLPPISGLRRPALSCFIQTHSEAIISSHLYKEKIVYSRIIFIIFSFYIFTFIAGRYKIYFCMILADNHEHN